MDFLDSVEFAGLGLLAIALMSISSPDDNIRKLGYEVVGKFMDGLEKRGKKRDLARLRLLLTYLQNAINKHLMQSSRINMKVIPFFHDYFWSSSVNFKKDRIWMLSLLCAGVPELVVDESSKLGERMRGRFVEFGRIWGGEEREPKEMEPEKMKQREREA
ncbi:hypothetical protein Droror1_Dr00010481 [Drosera rotundifolia]